MRLDFELIENEFWDCECMTHYIHPKTQLTCDKCSARAENQPNAKIEEIIIHAQPGGFLHKYFAEDD